MSQLKKLKRDQAANPDRFNTKFLQEDAKREETQLLSKSNKAGKAPKAPKAPKASKAPKAPKSGKGPKSPKGSKQIQAYNSIQEETTFQEGNKQTMQERSSSEQVKPLSEMITNKITSYSEDGKNLQVADIYIDDLGINMKDLFFDILEMLVNKQNPVPYIMSTDRIQFTFAIMVLLLGGLMLFLSNLMINQNNN
jgi:hypothetical protein